MFWVMRQPTWHMRFRRDRADCGDRGLSALSALPGQGTGSFRVSPFSIVSCTPPHVPPERSVPCRFAWPLPGGRARNTFRGDQRKVERRNASKTQARPEPPATCTLPLPGTCMPARRSLSRRSPFHARESRLAGPARREQLERRDPPPGGRGRGRCAVPPDHTPAGPPGPARAVIGPASARVESP